MTDINIQDILFIDIETVPKVYSSSELDKAGQAEWKLKAESLRKTNFDNDIKLWDEYISFFPEFSKVIAVTVGVVRPSVKDDPGSPLALHLRTLSADPDDPEGEAKLLVEVGGILTKAKEGARLCAHNGIKFDFPFLAKRFVINGFNVPPKLQTYGKKPWELTHLDTKELWKMGGYEGATLSTLCWALGIESPKTDMDGSMVRKVYLVDKDVPRIVKYSQSDVIALVQLWLRMHLQPLIEPQNIIAK